MKIAHFSDAFFPNVNGVTFALDQFSQEQAKKHQVRLYVPAYIKGKMTERRGRVEIKRYYSVPMPAYKDAHLTVPDLLDIYKSINEFEPDIIHFHSPGSLGLVGILMAKIMKIPLVGTYHTLFSEMLDYVSVRKRIDKYLIAIDKAAAGVGLDLGLLRNGEQLKNTETAAQKLTWTVVNRIYSYADKIVCPSEAVARELSKRKVSRGKLAVVSNGLDLKKFWPKKGYRMNNRLLHVGRLGFEKNVEVVIKAFDKIIDTKEKTDTPLAFPPNLGGKWGVRKLTLVIAGDGPAKKEMEKLATDLGIKNRVRFLGMIKRDKLPGVYRSADIFLTASDMETLGLVVLEAMASGLPVVAVDKYAMCDMVKEGINGYRVSPGNDQEMALKTLKLVADEKLREEMGHNSRQMSEKYGISEMMALLDKLYEGLI